jgi:aspartokinase-like uncharacterized kinase
VGTVVKVGGALLRDPSALDRVVRALEIAGARGEERLLVVPGGGVFANAVRDADRCLGLDPSVCHWMAILGMEQYALLLASRIANARLVDRESELHGAGAVLVLAPFRWLRERDPLPHSWDVTSDSIAAWVAGQVGARRLLLVKPVTGPPATLVDPYFEHVVPSSSQLRVVVADSYGLTDALRET